MKVPRVNCTLGLIKEDMLLCFGGVEEYQHFLNFVQNDRNVEFEITGITVSIHEVQRNPDNEQFLRSDDYSDSFEVERERRVNGVEQ